MKVYKIKRIFWQKDYLGSYNILKAKAKWRLFKDAVGDFSVKSKNGIKIFFRKSCQQYIDMTYEPGVFNISISKIYQIEETGENKFNDIWENLF